MEVLRLTNHPECILDYLSSKKSLSVQHIGAIEAIVGST